MPIKFYLREFLAIVNCCFGLLGGGIGFLLWLSYSFSPSIPPPPFERDSGYLVSVAASGFLALSGFLWLVSWETRTKNWIGIVGATIQLLSVFAFFASVALFLRFYDPTSYLAFPTAVFVLAASELPLFWFHAPNRKKVP